MNFFEQVFFGDFLSNIALESMSLKTRDDELGILRSC